MKVLIADDSIVARKMLRGALHQWGFEVVSVANGEDALASLQGEHPPALAILDVDMPGMSGTEVCKAVRQTPQSSRSYLILLTGNTDKAAVAAGLDAGADDYVTKPFDHRELRARVQVGVRMAELQDNLANHNRKLHETFAQLELSSTNLAELNQKMLTEIKARRRAEEEFRLHQILLDCQSEATLDGVLVVSAEGKIISVNSQFIEIWGLADGVIAAKSGATAMAAMSEKLVDASEFLELADRQRKQSEEKSNTELILKDGRVLHYYSAPVNSSDGVNYGRASYFRDVTERKRADELKAQLTARIESQRQRLNSIVATLPGLVWESWGKPDSDDEQIAFVSDYVETMLGYSVVEWTSTPNFWLSILHPDDKERAISETAASFVSGEGKCTNEYRWIAKDGRAVWVESNFVVIRNKEGQPIGLRGVTTDISQRKHAEEALRESQERYKGLIDSAFDGVLVKKDGIIKSANRAYAEMFGYTVEDLVGMQVSQLTSETDDASSSIAAEQSRYESIGLRKDGTPIDIEVSAKACLYEGEPARLTAVRDITERKRIEVALRESELRYRDLVENARDIMYSHDLSGKYTSVNKANEEITGYTREETLQMNIAEVIAPDHLEKAGQMLKNKISGAPQTAYELEIIAKDGHRVSLEVNTHLVMQGDIPVRIQGTARDVTERKQAEALQKRRAAQLAMRADINSALAASNTPLRSILERCTEAIVHHLGAAFARIWTLNREENMLELQASAGMYTHIDGPHARVPVGSFKIGLIAQEREPHITNEVQTDPRVGDKPWAEREGMVAFAGYPLIVEDRLVGVIAMFARQALADDTLDVLASISDIISQGIERKRVEEQLRDTAERYRLLFENNPHPMWVYDIETLSFSAVNEAAIVHYGYSREEFLSMTVKDIRPPEDLPVFLDHLTSLSDGIIEDGIWRHRKKDGNIIDVEITSHELLLGGRRAELVLANDITKRRKLEVQLRHGQKLESIGQLAAGIAHEINTPTQFVGDNLRFIQEAFQSHSDVMEKYSELLAAAQSGAISGELLETVTSTIQEADLEYVTTEVPKALQQSLEGIEHIAKIVQSMKDFAHPGSTEKQASDLNRALESTINIARGEWKYVAEMETDFDTDLPLVPCLLGELNQMTLNLIINSAHAIAAKLKAQGHEGLGLIKISTRRDGNWAVIRVSDTGSGIPEAIRARIFDPFFTTKEVGKGTGQGLAISHTVVEKHKGTITFETAEGEGTTFIIRLPLSELAESPDGQLKEAA